MARECIECGAVLEPCECETCTLCLERMLMKQSRELSRVTAWEDCIVSGCLHEYGHEGPHAFAKSPNPEDHDNG